MLDVRSLILGANEAPSELVPVPALAIKVRVRGMTGAERDAFEASCFEGRGKKRQFTMNNLRAKMVAFCCVDDAGKRLFTDDDAVQLGKVRADVIDQLFSVAQRLSGMSNEDVDELGLSSPVSSGTSSSVSPANSE